MASAAEERQGVGGRGSQVWQAKDLWEGDFGSVAKKGLTRILETADASEGGVRRTAGRGRISNKALTFRLCRMVLRKNLMIVP